MTEVRIDDNCPDLDENYYEALSGHQEIDVENGPETEIEDDLSFMEADIDAPKEEKHQTKQIDMSWLMDIIKKDEQNKEKELEARYTFDDLVAELLTNQIKELGNKFIGWNKFDISCDTVKKFIKPLTCDEQDMFIQRMTDFPNRNELFYPFQFCNFDNMPNFVRKDFINLFLEYKNTFKESYPSVESLNHAAKIIAAPYKELEGADKKVIEIKNEGTYQQDDAYYYYSGDFDLTLLTMAAEKEYFHSHPRYFANKYDEYDSLNNTILVVDYLCRHDELVMMLEKLKLLRDKTRKELRLPNGEDVGF